VQKEFSRCAFGLRGYWETQRNCKETTAMLLRAMSALAAALIVASTSASVAGGAKRVASDGSYARGYVGSDAVPTRHVKPFTIEERLLFERAIGSRW
jgi:hypothetical protein